jgi:tetratricopeptide (TPR) repeat protein
MPRATTVVLVSACLFSAGCAPRAGRTETTSADVFAASDALQERAPARALDWADRASSRAPEAPRPLYQRGVALAELGRTAEAALAFRRAEALFASAGDARGRAISIYGRARAFDAAGSCEDAREAYEAYADVMRDPDPSLADMALAYAKNCRPARVDRASPVTTEMASATIVRDYERALALRDRLPADAPPSGWLEYQTGVALAGLGRTTDAVLAFDRGEAAFGYGPEARLERSVALWGRARALEDGGRPWEAAKAYDAYAKAVADFDPASAQEAQRRALRSRSGP